MYKRQIWTSASDIKNGKINVYNEYFFRSLDAYIMNWDLSVNGKIVEEGIVSKLDVPARETVEPVSYTHLDVYKRQLQEYGKMLIRTGITAKARKS